MTTTVTERGSLTVLRAAWLFDGTSLTVTANPAVVLDGDKIVSVGSATDIPAGATVVDLKDATLLPGLIDTHVHLAFDASEDPVAGLARRDDEATIAAMRDAARTAVYGGVTTVRDLGDRDFLSFSLRGDPSLPTILAAGPPITSPGGHCHFLGGEASGVDGIRSAIRHRMHRAGDVIKIMASGGNLTPGSLPERSQFGPEELRAAVEEAHRHNLPITAHVHGTQSIIDAVNAGVDGLEHVSFMTADGVDEAPPKLIKTIVDKGIVLGLTLGAVPIPGLAPPPAIATRLPALMANTRRLVESGARYSIGSDAGIGPIKPHDVVRWAAHQLSMIGVSTAEALHAMTSNAAEVCGLGASKGRIRPGYDADILAVDGNPLDDPTALHRIRAVYCRGVAIR